MVGTGALELTEQDRFQDDLPPWLILVKSTTGIPWLGAEIVKKFESHNRAILRAIGAGAVNQAAKGVANATLRFINQGEVMFAHIGLMTVKGRMDDDVSATVFNCVLMSRTMRNEVTGG